VDEERWIDAKQVTTAARRNDVGGAQSVRAARPARHFFRMNMIILTLKSFIKAY